MVASIAQWLKIIAAFAEDPRAVDSRYIWPTVKRDANILREIHCFPIRKTVWSPQESCMALELEYTSKLSPRCLNSSYSLLFLFPSLCHLRMCSHICVYVCVCAHACTRMCKPQVNLGSLSSGTIYLIFETLSLHTVPTNSASLTSQQISGIPLLLPPASPILDCKHIPRSSDSSCGV